MSWDTPPQRVQKLKPCQRTEEDYDLSELLLHQQSTPVLCFSRHPSYVVEEIDTAKKSMMAVRHTVV